MGRSTHHKHGLKHFHIANQPEGWNPESSARVTSWCNDVVYMSAKERERSLRNVTCPKCAANIGKHKLAKLGGRVELKKPADYDKEPWRSSWGARWKGAWEFWLDGIHRGYILCDNGWGKPWELRALNAYADAQERPWGYEISGRKPSRHSAASEFEMFSRVHFAARDAMAVAAVKAAEAGLLPTAEEFAAKRAAAKVQQELDDKEREENRRRATIERERRETEEQERRATAREALASLESRIDLSNLELAGLAAVRTLLKMESANEGA